MPQQPATETPDAPSRPRGKPVALTPAGIRAIRPPASGREDHPDGATPGLCLRVPSTGAYVWTLRMRDGSGGLRRFVLGTMTTERGLAWARREAERLRQEVRHRGADPHKERRERVAAAQEKAERDRLTLGVLVQDWRRLHRKKNGQVGKPAYLAEAERALAAAFAAEWDRPAAALTAKQVQRALLKLSDAGRGAIAGGTMRYGRAAFGWAMKRGMVADNPFLGQDTPSAISRDRVLTDGELVEVLRAAEKVGGTFGAIVRVLAFTGQRRDEVAGMEWPELSEDRATWTIPGSRTKNSQVHIVPLPAAVRELLPTVRPPLPEGKRQIAKGKQAGTEEDYRPLMFPGERGGAVYSAWSQAKARLDAKIAETRKEVADEAGQEPEALPAWRLHDLRRTVATGLQALGIRLEVTEAVLNHVSGSRGGIVGVYQRHTWATEKRAALDAWAAHVQALIAGKPAQGDNVVVFRQAG